MRKRATEQDAYVGKQLRQRRTLLGMSQTALGDSVGLTFQQIQKYEKGSNRIGASRLWEFCKVLDCQPNFFFEGLDDANVRPANVPDVATGVMNRRETLELVRAYYKIDDAKKRQKLRELTVSMAS